MSDVPTPELDKRHKVIASGASDTLTGFYDWLRSQGICLATYREDLVDTRCCRDWQCIDGYVGGHRSRTCGLCGGTGLETVTRSGWVVDTRSPEQLFADFFGIDLRAINAEQRAVLDRLRSMATTA